MTDVDPAVANLDEGRKNCLSSSDDLSLSLFRLYSKAGCVLECNLRRAERECGCVPWDYPRSAKKNHTSN